MANKEIPRASDPDFIVVDENLSAAQSLYTPHFTDSEPTVGNNDPDKLGAIATTKEGSGDVELNVYQGGGIWKKVGGSALDDRLYEKSGSDVSDYELDLSSETGILYPASAILYINKKVASSATWDFSTKKWTGLPDTVSGDVIEAYYVGREYVAPPVTYNSIIKGLNFGSASAIQAYFISKGNSGALVDGYFSVDGNEFFRLQGVSTLASSTFAGSAITSFVNSGITSIGSNCFASSAIETFTIGTLTSIGIYAFANCASIGTLLFGAVQTINPGVFQNATGLNGKELSFPALIAPNGLGGSPADQIVFDGITNLTVNIPTAFATNNSGGPDADLVAVTGAGGTVNYI